MNRQVMFAWIAEIGFISYRTLSGNRITLSKTGPNATSFSVVKSSGPKRPPLPSELLATFIIFGAYAVIGEGDSPDRNRIASMLAWGTVLATALIATGYGQTVGASPNSQAQGKPTSPLTQPLPNQPPIMRRPS